jgi:DNA-binding transcriptional ArsR family regulator
MTRPLLREPDRIDEVAEMLKALGHPLRLRIIALLSEGDEHVSALAETMKVPPAIVSQQLRILRMNGLVSAVRANGQAIYRIREQRLYRLLSCMESHQ